MTGFDSKRQMAQDKVAQPAQEPVAWIGDSPTRGNGKRLFWTKGEAYHYATKHYPLFTAPQQRPWVGLTDDEIALIHADYPNPQGFAKAIQAALRRKNT
jgi:hypothetical protein